MTGQRTISILYFTQEQNLIFTEDGLGGDKGSLATRVSSQTVLSKFWIWLKGKIKIKQYKALMPSYSSMSIQRATLGRVACDMGVVLCTVTIVTYGLYGLQFTLINCLF